VNELHRYRTDGNSETWIFFVEFELLLKLIVNYNRFILGSRLICFIDCHWCSGNYQCWHVFLVVCLNGDVCIHTQQMSLLEMLQILLKSFEIFRLNPRVTVEDEQN